MYELLVHFFPRHFKLDQPEICYPDLCNGKFVSNYNLKSKHCTKI